MTQDDFKWFIDEYHSIYRSGLPAVSPFDHEKWREIDDFLTEIGYGESTVVIAEKIVEMTDEEFVLWKLENC